jgi:hypothetical protein
MSPYDAAEKNNFAIDPSDLIEPQRFFFDNIEQLRADANLDSIHSNSASMTTPYGDEIGEPLSEAQSAEMSLLQGITSYLHGSRDDSPPIPIDPALLSLDQRNNAQSPAPKQQTGELRRTRDYSAKIGSPLVAGIDKPRRLDGRNRNKNRV